MVCARDSLVALFIGWKPLMMYIRGCGVLQRWSSFYNIASASPAPGSLLLSLVVKNLRTSNDWKYKTFTVQQNWFCASRVARVRDFMFFNTVAPLRYYFPVREIKNIYSTRFSHIIRLHKCSHWALIRIFVLGFIKYIALCYWCNDSQRGFYLKKIVRRLYNIIALQIRKTNINLPWENVK